MYYSIEKARFRGLFLFLQRASELAEEASSFLLVPAPNKWNTYGILIFTPWRNYRNMGNVEKGARKRRRKRSVQGAVLGTLAAAGIVTVATVAPNVFQALPTLMGKQRYKLLFETKTALGKLAVKGHVRFIQKNGKKSVEITAAGRRALALQLARQTKPARKKRRWDHRYRLVMFDIPQSRKNVRDRLRLLMRECGFLRVQNSVWLSPYDCEELVTLIKTDLRLGTSVLYAVVEQIENDSWIKRHFGLK